MNDEKLLDAAPDVAPPGPARAAGYVLKHKTSVFFSVEVLTLSARITDFVMVWLAAVVATNFAGSFADDLDPDSVDRASFVLGAGCGSFLFGAICEQVKGYDFNSLKDLRAQALLIFSAWALTLGILLSLAFFAGISEYFPRGWVMSWGASFISMSFASRLVLSALIASGIRQGHLVRHVAVIGANDQTAVLLNHLRGLGERGMAVIGVFDDRLTRIPSEVEGVPVRGTIKDLLLLARETRIDEIVVTLPLSADGRLRAVVDKLRLLPVDVRLNLMPLTAGFPVKGLSYVGALPMLDVLDRPLKHWNGVQKRVEDLIIASLVLLFLMPLLVLIAILIKLDSRGPVFFQQDRFGFSNSTIRVLKFRSMYVDKGDETGAQRTVKDDPRVTRIGRHLRRLSLDELPQLINVLRGDMSIIGPRAHAVLMKAGDKLYYEAVEEYFHRHRVRPGMTGWAQVHGLRGEIDSLEKARARVEYDLQYIDRWSLWLDFKILLMTAVLLIRRENAY